VCGVSEISRRILAIAAGAVVLVALAYWLGGLLFDGGGDKPSPRFQIERTDDNNVVCFDCRHRFTLTWQQLGEQSAAGRTGDSAHGQPVAPPTCPSCGKAHVRYQVVNCPSRGILYVGVTPNAPDLIPPEQLEAFCEDE
jgi:hypothetical protein